MQAQVLCGAALDIQSWIVKVHPNPNTVKEKESYSQKVKGTVIENANTTIANYCKSDNPETDKSNINDDSMIKEEESYDQEVKATITDYEESNNSEVDGSGIESNTESLASNDEKSNNFESDESGIESD